jgi:SAM-dependent methyltransferase
MKKRKNAQIQDSERQDYSGIQELLDSEVGLIGYSSAIVHKFFTKMDLNSKILQSGGKLLEFGAGTGFLAEIFRMRYKLNPECVELDSKLVTLIRSKNFKCFQFLDETSKGYSAIYTSNVLEHIDDDLGILKNLFDSLIPGGVIGIYVPAHPFLFSAMDQQIGHVRRYSRSELKAKVQSAGFEIQMVTYDEFVGFFASIAVKIIGYKNRTKLGSRNSLVFYDKFVYPLSQLLDLIGFRFILGKNLFLVASKPNN